MDSSSAIDDADEERGEAIAHVFRVYLDDFGIGGVAEVLEEFPDGYFMLDVPPATFPCCFFVFCTREFREERIFFEELLAVHRTRGSSALGRPFDHTGATDHVVGCAW